MHRTIRFAAVALLLLVLGTVPVHARTPAAHPSPAGVLGALWQWLSPLLPTWTKEGGMMDPNGGHPPGVTTTSGNSDSGSSMDPDGKIHGLLAPSPSSDAGGMMDPDG